MEPTRKGPEFQSPFPFSLGEIEVYPDTLEVVSMGISTRLEPKIMELLVYFSSKPGEVLSKDQILEDVWGGTTVVDEALQRAISILRKSLGDKKEKPRYLETISKKGYRLILTPRPLSETGRLEPGNKKERGNPSPLVIVLGAVLLGLIFYIAWTQISNQPVEAPPVPKADEN